MPEGANDRGDIDGTPATAVDYATGIPKRLTLGDVVACPDGLERLRVQAINVCGDGEVVIPFPQVITIADNETILDAGASTALWFDISTGLGQLGTTDLSNLPRAGSFGISGRILTSGRGWIIIGYAIETTAIWQLYEPVPLSFEYPIDKLLVPTRRQYFIRFVDDANDVLPTVGLELQVVLYP